MIDMEEAQQRIDAWLVAGDVRATLNLRYLQVSELPSIPDTVENISFSFNHKLTKLPALPAGLKVLDCMECELTELPILPTSLEYLNCSHNKLTELPQLPNQLKTLFCDHNQITNIQSFPDSIQILDTSDNLINNLPTLPPNLESFEEHFILNVKCRGYL